MNIETNSLGADENCVLQYLKNWPELSISGTEIARRAGGKARFLEDPRWAGLALSQLMELGLVEFDGHGKYRVKDHPTMVFGGQKRFIAPHLREILQKNGRKFETSVSPDKNRHLNTSAKNGLISPYPCQNSFNC